jgi:hypothetical protein
MSLWAAIWARRRCGMAFAGLDVDVIVGGFVMINSVVAVRFGRSAAL